MISEKTVPVGLRLVGGTDVAVAPSAPAKAKRKPAKAAPTERPRAQEPAALVSALASAGGDLQAEEMRLEKAILQLSLESVGLTVEQALIEICEKTANEDMADFDRCGYLQDRLLEIGLRYTVANPDMGLIRPGYLVLGWPSRLNSQYPELKPLHPLAHPYLMVG